MKNRCVPLTASTGKHLIFNIVRMQCSSAVFYRFAFQGEAAGGHSCPVRALTNPSVWFPCYSSVVTDLGFILPHSDGVTYAAVTAIVKRSSALFFQNLSISPVKSLFPKSIYF